VKANNNNTSADEEDAQDLLNRCVALVGFSPFVLG
jgi:hypothetical protein